MTLRGSVRAGIALALCAFAAGCPKGRSAEVDPALPEAVNRVAVAPPVAVLEAGAASTEPGARGRALALLVTHVGPAWAHAAFADPSEWVQSCAIDALGARHDPESKALLEALVSDAHADPYLRGQAALRAPGPVAAAAVKSAWAAEAEPWRIAPLALAGARLGDPAAELALATAVSTGDLPLDLGFVVELGRSGLPGLAPALETAETRVEEELVLPLAAARMMLGDATGEQSLRKALSDDDEERRLEALDFVVDVEGPAATALLRRASGLGPEDVTAYADLALAARTGDRSSVFGKAYADPDREIRLLAVKFAGRSQTPGSGKVDRGVTKVLLGALADTDAAVREEACRAVATLGMHDAVPALDLLIGDEVELVRIEAAGARLALGG